ncbi:MAG: rod shape-determining protein MreD [Fastidiosipilaceae bacterium]|jgi:rod shape-determining protein MreD|nr:rod shape-determining protein MreD [Clostridiaceae bacterium]
MRSKREILRIIFVYIFYIILVTWVQFMWPDMGMVKMIKPDLQLVLTLISAYLFGFRDGVVVGICCGILRDCISARYLGTGLLLLFLCGVFASFFMRKRFTNNLVTIFLLTFVITLIVETVIFIIQIAILRRPDLVAWSISIIDIFAARILPQILINIVATIPIYLLLRNFGPYPRRQQKEAMKPQQIEDVML